MELNESIELLSDSVLIVSKSLSLLKDLHFFDLMLVTVKNPASQV